MIYNYINGTIGTIRGTNDPAISANSVTISGTTGAITGINGDGIRGYDDVIISGRTGTISGRDYGISVNSGSLTISGSVGNNTYASISGGDAQIYVYGTEYGTSPTDSTRFPVKKQWP